MSWIHGSSSRLDKEWVEKWKRELVWSTLIFSRPMIRLEFGLSDHHHKSNAGTTADCNEPGMAEIPTIGWRHHVASILYPLWTVEHELFLRSGFLLLGDLALELALLAHNWNQFACIVNWNELKGLPWFGLWTRWWTCQGLSGSSQKPRSRSVDTFPRMIRNASWPFVWTLGGELSGVMSSSPVASRRTMSWRCDNGQSLGSHSPMIDQFETSQPNYESRVWCRWPFLEIGVVVGGPCCAMVGATFWNFSVPVIVCQPLTALLSGVGRSGASLEGSGDEKATNARHWTTMTGSQWSTPDDLSFLVWWHGRWCCQKWCRTSRLERASRNLVRGPIVRYNGAARMRLIDSVLLEGGVGGCLERQDSGRSGCPLDDVELVVGNSKKFGDGRWTECSVPDQEAIILLGGGGRAIVYYTNRSWWAPQPDVLSELCACGPLFRIAPANSFAHGPCFALTVTG